MVVSQALDLVSVSSHLFGGEGAVLRGGHSPLRLSGGDGVRCLPNLLLCFAGAPRRRNRAEQCDRYSALRLNASTLIVDLLELVFGLGGRAENIVGHCNVGQRILLFKNFIIVREELLFLLLLFWAADLLGVLGLFFGLLKLFELRKRLWLKISREHAWALTVMHIKVR